ncbi:Alanine racemase [Syntrophomonas zehnderi OL-4]|uniref:Alanine racemase n=1 Tax=Syntrophomonas zehnderi OL-4 TaxID=690567 RepID=A0A0E4G9B7_9FIRM|nr:serine racemase VanT catalytic subunit [Syntrophomonas zehnderi]CFX01070.1 Alanine racemase [Syntrophomonas zehnderi OL-4]
MTKNNQYGGLDTFKLIAALLVICIHTSPLTTFSANADFLLTRIIARIAVPFFLMVTGFFILPPYLFASSRDRLPLMRFLKKVVFLYAVAIIIYWPVNLYAGQFKGLDVADVIRLVLFDGTFYHLWYLPAVILGALMVFLLSRKLSFQAVMVVSLFLYGIGLMGDSYFGAISGVPVLATAYDAMFQVFSYTRNGLFYAPVFLTMGAWFAHSPQTGGRKKSAAGFALSILLMTIEGFVLHYTGWQRHDSMYVALLPCMYFLYQLVMVWDRKPNPFLRTISTWIYIIHPLFIVVVRGTAKVTGLVDILVRNSLIHYLAVAVLSVLFAVLVAKLSFLKKQKRFQKGRAWIELDRAALRHNVYALRALLPDGCELLPAVKTNAYGHGAVLISQELNRLGVNAFCVATVYEGAKLRKNRVKGTILVLGYTHPSDFSLLCRYKLTQTVLDLAYAQLLDQYGKKISVHVKIDTGMHRLGERSEKTEEIIRIFQCKNLKIEGVFTHLCVAGDPSPKSTEYTHIQTKAFYDIIAELSQRGFPCPKKHIVSSDGLLYYPELAENYARVGIALYGLLSSRADLKRCGISLEPVLSIKARIAMVKDLFQGEAAGYGLQFVASQDSRIAVVAIGYGDGIPRSLSCGVGSVLIQGIKAPIVGQICMDQMLVDISDIPNVKSGDIAVIIGQSGNEKITACDLAEQDGTISNEILSCLGERLERLLI